MLEEEVSLSCCPCSEAPRELWPGPCFSTAWPAVSPPGRRTGACGVPEIPGLEPVVSQVQCCLHVIFGVFFVFL